MDQLKSSLVKLVLKLIGCLPLTGARRLGAFVGWLGYQLGGRMVKVTKKNIELCLPNLPDAEQAELARRSAIETGVLAAETCVVWARGRDWVDQKLISYHGTDMLKAKLAKGKGLLVLAPHIGNWEILGIYLTSLGPVTNLYQPPKLKGIEELVIQSRARFGSKIVPTDRKGLFEVMKTLKEGGISGVLPDQSPREDSAGKFIPFFEKPAFTMTFAHKLIKKTGCEVVFGYARRVPTGFDLVFFEPDQDIFGDDEEAALRALNKGVEQCVLDSPEQYQWEYKRFKKQPDGAPIVYSK